ncbi:MAG: STN domain-containing protein, partial [Candidatus Omnitrophica bacterium]|nr:STN domain-containing protein [Candidatus Omnitrophota bacterium]
MRNNFKLSVFIFCFYLLMPNWGGAQELAPSGEIPISMDLQDASLKETLKILSIQSGLNFIASEAVQDRKITIYLDKVPLKPAMDKLFKANNLTYELDKQANIIIVKDWGKPEIETVTRVFKLKYATV